MKIFISCIALFIGINSFAQVRSIEITPVFGYSVSGNLTSYYGTYDVRDDMTWGGLLSAKVFGQTHLEFGYRRTHTEVLFDDVVYGTGSFDMGMEHYQLGAVQDFLDKEKIKGFATLTLGATRYWEQNHRLSESWRFSGTFGGGFKFFLNKYLGFRVQGVMVIPLQAAGAGLYCGFGTEGSGCETTINFDVPIIHGEFLGGVIFRINTKEE